MNKKRYSFYKNGVKHNREVVDEYYQYGRRFYLVKDLNNPDPKAESTPAIADDVDKYFLSPIGQIRKNKYTDKAFQKTRKKAGGV